MKLLKKLVASEIRRFHKKNNLGRNEIEFQNQSKFYFCVANGTKTRMCCLNLSNKFNKLISKKEISIKKLEYLCLLYFLEDLFDNFKCV